MSRASRATASHGAGSYRGRPFELIDTGGIITDDTEMIPREILKQARVALEDAAQVIFLIDGRAEITGADRDLAKMLRKLGKPVSLAVNKIDSPKREDLTHEFHALGFEHVFPVSAEHHLGLDDLLEHVTSDFPIDVARATKVEHPVRETTAAEHAKEAPKIKVAIIGRPNVGKSTLLNALTGIERSIVSPVAGTTRDAVDETMVRERHRIRLRRYRRHPPQGQDQIDGGKAQRRHGAPSSAHVQRRAARARCERRSSGAGCHHRRLRA